MPAEARNDSFLTRLLCQVELSNQKTGSLVKELAEALNAVAQARDASASLRMMVTKQTQGCETGVPIAAHAQQCPNGNWWPRQGQSALVVKQELQKQNSPAPVPQSLNIRAHCSRLVSNPSEMLRSDQASICLPAPAITVPPGDDRHLSTHRTPGHTLGRKTPTADDQLLCWWENAVGYPGDTSQSLAASGTGTGSKVLSEVKKAAEQSCSVSNGRGLAKGSRLVDSEISIDNSLVIGSLHEYDV